MTRALGLGWPAAGLTLGVLSLALWVSAISLVNLDLIVGGLLGIALAAALAGYFFGVDERTRRLAVVATGWNAGALALLAMFYIAG